MSSFFETHPFIFENKNDEERFNYLCPDGVNGIYMIYHIASMTYVVRIENDSVTTSLEMADAIRYTEQEACYASSLPEGYEWTYEV